jgi:hypothetical protein
VLWLLLIVTSWMGLCRLMQAEVQPFLDIRQEFNQYLSTLTEHNDIPRVSLHASSSWACLYLLLGVVCYHRCRLRATVSRQVQEEGGRGAELPLLLCT